MKRFVDVRGAELGGNFAWFDTVYDKFETHSDEQIWDTFEGFALAFEGTRAELERYRGLTPAWAKAVDASTTGTGEE
jgi:hypothetical protein